MSEWIDGYLEALRSVEKRAIEREQGAAARAGRELAAAIYAEMCSEATAAEALDLWQTRHIGASDLADMAAVLAAITRHAIDRALFRRLAEAVELTEPLTGDTKILDKRTGRIVATRRRGTP